MWSKRDNPPRPYPEGIGRILNRHKRAPKHLWWKRLKSSLFKLFIPAVLIALGFIILVIFKTMGLI